jgi:hypothetical protein
MLRVTDRFPNGFHKCPHDPRFIKEVTTKVGSGPPRGFGSELQRLQVTSLRISVRVIDVLESFIRTYRYTAGMPPLDETRKAT